MNIEKYNEIYEIEDYCKIGIKYEFFNPNDLKYFLNYLNGRFKYDNTLVIESREKNFIKYITFKKNAKKICVDIRSNCKISWIIDRGKNRIDSYNEFFILRDSFVGNNRYSVIIPYPDLLDDNYE